jgi:hypothetical protein
MLVAPEVFRRGHRAVLVDFRHRQNLGTGTQIECNPLFAG